MIINSYAMTYNDRERTTRREFLIGGRSNRRGPGDENGLYRGKGPRSYQRRDERIVEEINDRLCDNPYIDASEIDVEVSNGDVILKGSVNDRESKRLAEDIGDSVAGVKNVENRLRVKKAGI